MRMGLLARLADWFEATAPPEYHCANCGNLVDDTHSQCPDCGGDLEFDGSWAYHYRGPM